MPSSTSEKLLMLYARRFPMQRGKLRVINRFWRAASGVRSTHRVAVLNHAGFKMACDLNEMLQRQFYFFGTYFLEANTLDCWERMAGGAEVIFDVGANAGIYSLAALAVQPNAIVHAFEPTPEIAARLRATAKQNGLDHLYVHEQAVYSRTGRAILNRFRGENRSNEGMNFITADTGDPGAEHIDTVHLDRFCRDHAIDYVDLVKLDVQGHEHSALLGAEKLINTGRIGTIFTELNWATSAGATCPASEAIRLLDEAGYLFSKPSKNMNWRNAGDWLRSFNEVVARCARSDRGA